MAKKGARVGGATKIDPGAQAWLDKGAQNPATVTRKQRKDRARVRARYDIAPELKAAIEEEARSLKVDTSFSQFAELLLEYGLAAYRAGDLDEVIYRVRKRSRSLRFIWDLDLGEALSTFSDDGAV